MFDSLPIPNKIAPLGAHFYGTGDGNRSGAQYRQILDTFCSAPYHAVSLKNISVRYGLVLRFSSFSPHAHRTKSSLYLPLAALGFGSHGHVFLTFAFDSLPSPNKIAPRGGYFIWSG